MSGTPASPRPEPPSRGIRWALGRGDVVDAHSADLAVRGVRRLNEVMAADPLVSATVIQTVGAEGYDGFAIAIVVGESA